MSDEDTLLENQDSMNRFLEHNAPNAHYVNENTGDITPTWDTEPPKAPKGWHFEHPDIGDGYEGFIMVDEDEGVLIAKLDEV